jgi:hypothetical protein
MLLFSSKPPSLNCHHGKVLAGHFNTKGNVRMDPHVLCAGVILQRKFVVDNKDACGKKCMYIQEIGEKNEKDVECD